MNTKNAALTNFLDTKYIPLEPKFKIILAVLTFVLPIIAFYFIYLSPSMNQANQLASTKASLEKELLKVKKTASNLDKLKAELAEAQHEFDEKSILLPKEREIPQLLRDISSEGRTSGLDFLQFKPLPSKPNDFYDEIPVDINVRGPYHNVGYFLDQVSKLNRIVTVSNIRMSSPKLESGEILLNSKCQLVTYQFTNKPLSKPKKR